MNIKKLAEVLHANTYELDDRIQSYKEQGLGTNEAHNLALNDIVYKAIENLVAHIDYLEAKLSELEEKLK